MKLEKAIEISRRCLAGEEIDRVSADKAYDVIARWRPAEEGHHKGLPVAGYKPEQSQEKINLVNEGKILEEQVLRYIDKLTKDNKEIDLRWISIGKTDIQKGFMAVFRSVFQPERISLENDK